MGLFIIGSFLKCKQICPKQKSGAAHKRRERERRKKNRYQTTQHTDVGEYEYLIREF